MEYISSDYSRRNPCTYHYRCTRLAKFATADENRTGKGIDYGCVVAPVLERAIGEPDSARSTDARDLSGRSPERRIYKTENALICLFDQHLTRVGIGESLT